MPTTTVRGASQDVAAHVDLPALGEVTRVVFDTHPVYEVEVINRGDATVWFTVDGRPASVAGAGSYCLPGRSVAHRRTGTGLGAQTVVTLLAEAGTPVSVQRLH